MSNKLKTQLFVATAMFAVSSTAAFAQQTTLTYPAAELHGVGASSIQITLQRELNCFGPSTAGATGNPRGANTPAITAVTAGKGADTTAAFQCGSDFIQPNIGGLFIATGSSDGKTAFKNKTVTGVLTNAKWPGAMTTGAFAATAATIYGGTTSAAWGNAHFALSDAPLSAAELSTYGNTTQGGAAIQFPLYVIPVALAYNQTYGLKYADATLAGTPTALKFKVAQPVPAVGGANGGLRLSKKVYCRIFNGYITNWNSSEITALNTPAKGAAYSLKADADSTTRWDQDGVPIRLVGRFDGSGTTDIFTHHLKDTCTSGLMGSGTTNVYTRYAEGLPWDPTQATLVRESSNASTKYVNGKPTTDFAGDVNMIAAVYHSTTGAIVTGTETLGKFGVVNGSSGVSAIINLAAEKPSANEPSVLLNGKLGYISADFVVPAPDAVLSSAALEIGTSTATKKPLFAMPTALNATAAFGTKILPPESDKGGKYVKGGSFSRSAPLDWVKALYDGDSQLSNPPVGYPITGTTQILTGTCFASPAVRNALVTVLTAKVGKLTFDNKFGSKKALANLFTSTATKTLGIPSQAGLATLPKAWNTAIYETFLIRSKQKNAADGALLVDRNLYIQAGIPTKAGIGKNKNTMVVGDLPTTSAPLVSGKTVYEAAPNSTCATVTGL
ncbi:MAG: substrate-binding domain-containing protein [Novosphingobium sp.]|uniref:substrate-binding domain-containing protein n=1 Tax=Novosphingobium sp. TaxID=1874826 RepID=UPI003017FB87